MRTKIFDNWTFRIGIPEPFLDAANHIVGNKVTSQNEFFSVHNIGSGQKSSTLHGPTLRALIQLADIFNEESNGAVGYQGDQSGHVNFICAEFPTVNPEGRKVIVYNLRDGKFKGAIKGNGVQTLPMINQGKSSGKDLISVLAYASCDENSHNFNNEFADNFWILCDQKKRNWPDEAEYLKAAFICCDNLYSRIEHAESLGDNGIAVHADSISTGNIPLLTVRNLDGRYAPTTVKKGQFIVLLGGTDQIDKTVTLEELCQMHHMNLPLNDEEIRRIPDLPSDTLVTKHAVKILNCISKTPMRTFMERGDSGTGKTTDARVVSRARGLPYYRFICSEGTDEITLVSTYIPNVSSTLKMEDKLVSFQDIMMDPASALAMVTDEYEEAITQEDAFDRIIQGIYQKGYRKAKEEKDFLLVESDIVKACRRPSLIEIQEASVIGKPGTIVKLNGLLDDGASITLSNGEEVIKHPDTIVFWTTNMNYRGTKKLNESLLSRINLIIDVENISVDEMVSRAALKTGFNDTNLLKKMAETVYTIREYCAEEMIDDGVCGSREYIDWVWAYMCQGDVVEAAKDTILSHATQSLEAKQDILDACVLTKFEQESQAA